MKKLPKFRTQEEAAKYWETHSFEDYRKDTKNGEIVFAKKAKETVAIRLDPDDIKSVEKIAERGRRGQTYSLRIILSGNVRSE